MKTSDRDRRDFGGNREIAIQRDGEKCVTCGMTRDEHRAKYGGKDITVDHIDGSGMSKPKHLKNNALSNLQTLCLGCHGRKDSRLVVKLTPEDVRDIRMFASHGMRLIAIHKCYQMLSDKTIVDVARRRSWKHITDYSLNT